MRAHLAFLLVASLLSPPQRALADRLPRPTTGTLERLSIHSAYVDERPVDVWLPADYAARVQAGHRYQVLYMHDGQMLFDASTTWNKQAWHADVTLDRLIRSGRVPDTIIVGIWNNGAQRPAEYLPEQFLSRMPPAARSRLLKERLGDRPQSDHYLRFLVEELKPLIDQRYATRPEASATFIMGSSMGGLISVYAYCEYPQVFGNAAGLSTHWVGIFEPNAAIPLAAFSYLAEKLPSPAGRRLYLDRGTETLDALYQPAQTFVDLIVREHGYQDDQFMSRVFPAADHSENAWSARLELPMQFLLAPKPRAP